MRYFIPPGKKAFTFETLVLIIIVSIGMVLMAAWIGDAMETTKDNVPKEICKRSVQTHAALQMKGVDFNTETIVCPTEEITITKKKDEDINAEVTHAMYDCWDQFQQGRYTLFDDDGVYCSVCHIIDFKEKGKTVSGLSQYQMETNVPGTKEKYASFFAVASSEDSDWLLDQMKDQPQSIASANSFSLDTSKTYATIFVYTKGEDYVKTFGTLLKGMADNPLTTVFIAGGVIAIAGGGVAVTTSGITHSILAGIAGKAAVVSGTTGATALLWEYLTNDVGPDHVAFIAIREFSADSMKELNCQVIPVRQGYEN